MRRTGSDVGGSRYWAVALILAAGIGLGFPALHNGMPNGHDSYEHVSRYSSVASQFREGEIYPRWLANMNSGLGSPVLFVYAPLPYFVPAFLSPLLRLLESVQQLTNPAVQLTFAGIVRDRLKNADRHPIFSAVEIENIFTGISALFLFPLKEFLNFRVFDNRDALVVIKKPLNHIRQRVIIDVAKWIAR